MIIFVFMKKSLLCAALAAAALRSWGDGEVHQIPQADYTYGVVVPGRRTSPAYAPAFIDAVKAQTGDRYVKRELK